jgi:hypothetical protein
MCSRSSMNVCEGDYEQFSFRPPWQGKGDRSETAAICESFRQALQEFFEHTVEFIRVIDK